MRKVSGTKNDNGYELRMTIVLNSEQIEDRKNFLKGQIRGMEREIARLTNLKSEQEDELATIEELIK